MTLDDQCHTTPLWGELATNWGTEGSAADRNEVHAILVCIQRLYDERRRVKNSYGCNCSAPRRQWKAHGNLVEARSLIKSAAHTGHPLLLSIPTGSARSCRTCLAFLKPGTVIKQFL